MELVLNQEEIVSCRCIAEKAEKQNLDLTWNLPDYCGDIKRMIKCVAEPGINGISVSGDRATASGEIDLRLIYLNDNDEIDCYTDTCSLSVSTQLGELPEDAQFLARASVDFLNPHAISGRRCTLSGAISVRFHVYSHESQAVLCKVDGCGCQEQKKSLSCMNLLSFTEKTFDLSETVEIPDSEFPASKILFQHGDLKLESQKAVIGKLLLRGELELDLLYLADEAEHTLVRLHHSLPISQIIEAQNADETSVYSICLRLQMLETRMRADSSGTNRLLDIAAKVCASVRVYREKEIMVITDCFATQGAIHIQKSDLEFCSQIRPIVLNTQQKQRIELNEQHISSIQELRVLNADCSMLKENDKLMIHCVADVAMLLKNRNDQISYCERRLEYDNEYALDFPAQAIQAEPVVRLQDMHAVLNAENEAELSFQSCVSADLFVLNRETVCVSVQPDDSKQDEGSSALTLYFARKGEEIWEIAKHYATSCSAILEENDLNGEFLTEDRMLLVPRV